MKNAKTLLIELLAAFPDGQAVAALFAENGVVELPFLYSVGIEPRYQGREAIADFYGLVKQLYPDFRFEPQNTQILIETPEQVFAEYAAHPTAAATGRQLHHLFAGRLVAGQGRILLLRESLNVVAVAQALLPGGVADLPGPADEIYSTAPDYRS